MIIYYIYKITNNINSKVYTGFTKHSTRRMAEHKKIHKFTKYKSALYNAMRLYGVENFTMEVIFCALDRDFAYEMEKKFIVELNSMCPNGYNIDPGGKGGNKIPDKHAIFRDMTSGEIVVAESNCDQVNSGELVGINKGMKRIFIDNKEFTVPINSEIYSKYTELLNLIEKENLTEKFSRPKFSTYKDKQGKNVYLAKDHPDVLSGIVVGVTKGFVKVRYLDTGAIVQIPKDHIDLVENRCVNWVSGTNYCTNGSRIFIGYVGAANYFGRDASVYKRLCKLGLDGWKHIDPFEKFKLSTSH
jgi:group I intron endonuclease